MRKKLLFNDNWIFNKNGSDTAVTLPHTWNASDGQDGGNDYYRGKCSYTKNFSLNEIPEGSEVWLEFRGVAMSAEVYVNDVLAGSHKGGYSTFRVNISQTIKEHNTVTVYVDNSETREVYPQKADFTFYGGIYRDVYLLIVPKQHFALGHWGSGGLMATPKISGTTATVLLEALTENTADGAKVEFSIDGISSAEAVVAKGKASAEISIENVHLWDGLSDPFMYKATAKLESGDLIDTRFGCRSFYVDPEKGFFLNGRSYPLCGVSRHQDRESIGSALTPAMHKEDMDIIKEMGANTIRLAHYQHDQYFYDLCDEAGLIVWAEIPYISEHMPEANEHTKTQMTELVLQNYNHPSIVCWGLSNEITASGFVTDDLLENHRQLNDLCHRLDPSRLTTMASIFILETESKLNDIPDIRSYNLYYGWYVGEVQDNDKWFDEFHEKFPEKVIGLSEYGADANPKYQTANPQKGDYTEAYQALYHEHMLKMWSERPYIWAMHVWNMFDFAADGREEGGKRGINQKGLVTFDRKLKKDAFYIYKAYLTKEPFAYICGRRYIDRTEEKTEIKVYSNQPEVSLYVDGKLTETKKADKVFKFEIAISAEHKIKAICGNAADEIIIRHVSEPNPEYVTVAQNVLNWFDEPDMEIREGYYSICDTMGEIRKSPAGKVLIDNLTKAMVKARGDVAQNVVIPEAMQQMIDRQPLQSILRQAGSAVSPEDIKALNTALNNIPKVEWFC